jgi:formylmethanofuran dehydrogenase subunit C
MIALTLKEIPPVPLEAEVLTPDVVAGLAPDAIRMLPANLGKTRRTIGDFFAVDGEPGDEIEIRGDAAKVKWIGRGMTRGRVRIVGNAGMHLGGYMKGGTIEVTGSASDWLGAEMSGGLIRVGGNAGGQVGAAHRGSQTGMTNGTIVIAGSAGLEVGMRMRRGLIVVGGRARDFAGLQMKGGTIVLGAGAELRTGAWMSRGTIVSLQPIPLLATFSYASTDTPTFLRVYARHLRTLGFTLPCEERDGAFARFSGDTSVPGKGEILVWKPRTAS